MTISHQGTRESLENSNIGLHWKILSQGQRLGVSNSHFPNGHRLLFILFYMATPCYTIGSVVIREKTDDDIISLQ